MNKKIPLLIALLIGASFCNQQIFANFIIKNNTPGQISYNIRSLDGNSCAKVTGNIFAGGQQIVSTQSACQWGYYYQIGITGTSCACSGILTGKNQNQGLAYPANQPAGTITVTQPNPATNKQYTITISQ